VRDVCGFGIYPDIHQIQQSATGWCIGYTADSYRLEYKIQQTTTDWCIEYSRQLATGWCIGYSRQLQVGV